MPNAEPRILNAPNKEFSPSSPHDGARSHGAINLNAASEEEIAEIDMIGKKIAHAIVARRTAQGPFSSWEDLKGVEGLEPTKFAELQRAARIN